MSCVVLFAGVAQAGAPAIPPRPSWTAPVAQERKLASGARAWVLPRPGLPLVHVSVVISAGSLVDPADKPGLAALTATALEEGGAADKSPDQVLAAFDALGTQLDVSPGDEAVTLSLTVLSSKLEPALRQLVELLAAPRFDAKAFGSVRERRLTEIAQQRDDPGSLANLVLADALYGKGPRGHDPLGTAQAVGAMTLDDVKQFYRARWVSPKTTFVLAGDVTADGAQRLLDAVAPKAWLPASLAPAPAADVISAPGWVGVDKPGAPQTVLRLARPSFGAKDPRVPAMDLVSVVLGGAFTSRLNQNLREKHGYTYGVRASLETGAEAGQLAVSTAVKTEVSAEALTELLSELRGITTLSPEEHAKGRALLEAKLVEMLSSGQAAAGAYGWEASLGLGPDKLSKYGVELAGANLEQVLAAAKDWAPDGFTVVIVGDRARLEKPLAKAFPKQTITWRAP